MTWEVGTEARWGQWIVRWQWDVFWEEAEAEEHTETGEDDQEEETPDELQKKKKKKNHQKFIDEEGEEEEKMMMMKKKRKMKNTDTPYISVTPDWSALIARLRTTKGAHLGPMLKKKLELKHP